MNRELIRRWNDVVCAEDTVYHLGDFSFLKDTDTASILHTLNGKIHLIRGNHDKKMKAWLLERFASVQDYLEIKIDDQFIVMCHYAFLVWNKSHYGSWNLFGHSHNSLVTKVGRRMDVGIDCNPEYQPFSFEEIKAYMAAREFEKADGYDERRHAT